MKVFVNDVTMAMLFLINKERETMLVPPTNTLRIELYLLLK